MKWIAIAELVIIIVLVGAFSGQYISLKRPAAITRKPSTPNESTLTYTAPPRPKLSLDVVKQATLLKQLLTPTVDKITDDIYLARGFALGSVQMVITNEGLVIIDTTESEEAAKSILNEFRKITDKPIKYVIYTHGHLDHVQGTRVFMEPETQVIATADAIDLIKKDMGWLRQFHTRSRLNQAGRLAADYALPLPFNRHSPVTLIGTNRDIVLPTIPFDKKYSFSLGGKTFEISHTSGETPDHLMVWLPDEKALFSGDLYYAAFPNLSTPMLEPRPVAGWFQSIDRMIALEPNYLIPGHSMALIGKEKIHDMLTNYSKAIRYVYEETLKGINAGKDVNQLAHDIRLPKDLAELPYLQEYYGNVSWSVRGIYQGLVGWYNGRGTELSPLPPGYRAAEIVRLAGGADKVLARAIELQKSGEHQLVCELCDVVIAANPKDKLAHVIKASSLDYLGYATSNLNAFGFYRSAAALEREEAEVKP
jgi:alkyl sulfatase BDS1-like metallo-beta-lactamase superfamily hydrolase